MTRRQARRKSSLCHDNIFSRFSLITCCLFAVLTFAVLEGVFFSHVTAGEIVAAEDSGVEESGAGQQKKTGELLDQYHKFVESRINEPAIWFDSFFGEPHVEDYQIPVTFVRLRTSARWQDGNGFSFPVRLRANIKLPEFSKRLRFIITGENKEDQSDKYQVDPDNPDTSSTRDEERTNVGLRYYLYSTLREKFHFGGGLRVHVPIEAYVRGRYIRVIHMGADNQIRFSETVFWFTRQGLGETSRLDFEKEITGKTLVRFTLTGTYAEESEGYEWGSEVSLFRKTAKDEALSLDLGVFGYTRPETEVGIYRIGTRYRKSFYRPWLFFEIEPEITWPLDENDNRKATGAITLTFEVQFAS